MEDVHGAPLNDQFFFCRCAISLPTGVLGVFAAPIVEMGKEQGSVPVLTALSEKATALVKVL